MSPERIAAVLLVVGVALAWIRLALWQRRAPSRRGPWRVVALVILQPAVAATLYLTLFGLTAARGTGTLVIATEGAPRLIPLGAAETLVTLPEAHTSGATLEPDLGTALRHHPGTQAIRIVGSGLTARDRAAATGITVRYDAPAGPQGLVGLTLPSPTAPGERFAISAQIVGGGTATLIDPAGRVVDTAKPATDGSVILHGTARVPGEALFTLRLGDGEQATVPVVTTAATLTRALIVAGAPNPEVKFLRRWAADAGLAPQAQVAVGAGVSLGDPAAAITPAVLARTDVAIVDDRIWASASARATLSQAVRDGMGLIVRLTGPVPRGWQALGVTAGGSAQLAALRLPPAAPSDAALAARRGPGTRDVPASIAAKVDEMPEITRVATTLSGVPLLRDARGSTYAAWRNAGRGRVAVVTLIDSFALVTSGSGDAHAELWSTLASTVGRGKPAGAARIEALPRVGERVAICEAGDRSVVTAPDGANTPLVPDPAAAGCAGYWPQAPGWHRLGTQPFYVQPAAALPHQRAAIRRDATMTLVGERAGAATPSPVTPQPSWRWFLAFLATAGLLWWLERRRR